MCLINLNLEKYWGKKLASRWSNRIFCYGTRNQTSTLTPKWRVTHKSKDIFIMSDQKIVEQTKMRWKGLTEAENHRGEMPPMREDLSRKWRRRPKVRWRVVADLALGRSVQERDATQRRRSRRKRWRDVASRVRNWDSSQYPRVHRVWPRVHPWRDERDWSACPSLQSQFV